MTHQQYFITGLAVVLVVVLGSAGVTYLFLTQSAPGTPNSRTTVSRVPHKQASVKKGPTIQTKARPVDSIPQLTPHPQPAVEAPGPSLVHASTVSVATPSAPTQTRTTAEAHQGTEAPPIFADLSFGLSRTGLDTKTKAILDTYAARLQDPHWSVLVQGHTDTTGSIRKNLYVGLRRAQAVKEYLMTKGIVGEQLHAVSFGEYTPVCTANTPACQSKNRRVSFAIVRRDDLTPSHAVPATPEPVVQSANRPVSREVEQILASLPDIAGQPENTPVTVELIYPGPVHSTPPSR